MLLPIEAAILRTILYADVFNFPLTLDEIHRYLISDIKVAKADIEKCLCNSPKMLQLLHHVNGYICLQSREDIIELRKEREAASQAIWQSAINYGQLLSHIPFVQMVALTGALAVRNPSSMDDDFDYLLITKPKRVWFARACAIVLVRLVRFFGRELCPNYVLASDQLYQSRQDIYMAHEVAQMRPIYGAKLYQAMYQENRWTQHFLPNATPYTIENDKPRRIRKLLEWVFNGWLGDWIEDWEYRRKLHKFQPQLQNAQSTAEINQSSVKGHFEDHGKPVMTRYEELLYEYGLYQQTEALAGD